LVSYRFLTSITEGIITQLLTIET